MKVREVLSCFLRGKVGGRGRRDEEGGRRGEQAYLTFHLLFPSFSFFYLVGWMMTL